MWRNRELEEKNRAAESNLEAISEEPGVILNIAKQRNGDFEGRVGLWFDQRTYRYYSAADRSMWGRLSYVDAGASQDCVA